MNKTEIPFYQEYKDALEEQIRAHSEMTKVLAKNLTIMYEDLLEHKRLMNNFITPTNEVLQFISQELHGLKG